MTDYSSFFDGDSGCTAIFDKLRHGLLEQYPDMQVLEQKTCLSFRNPRPFCYVSLSREWNRRKDPDRYVIVTFGLDMPVPDPRIRQCVQVTPNRFTHHVIVRDAGEIDEQLLAWIHMAHLIKNQA